MSSRLIIDGNVVYEIDEDCQRNGNQKPIGRAKAQDGLKKQEDTRRSHKKN